MRTQTKPANTAGSGGVF